MKIVNSEEMQFIDKKTEEALEYPSLLLMENAGIDCYNYLKENIFTIYGFDKTVFVCGKKCYKDKGFFASEDILEYIPLIIKNIKQDAYAK